MNWYYVNAGQQAGPVSDEQLDELRRAGNVTDATLVWREGMAEWQPLGQVRPAPPGSPPPTVTHATFPATSSPGAVCAECRQLFAISDMIRHGDAYICAGCKPIFMQKLAEGARIETGALNYAGFWIRVAAKIVDGLILGVVFLVPIIFIVIRNANQAQPEAFDLAMIIFQVGYYFVGMLYSVFFVGKYGATPGKMVCKLQVVTADGGKVGYGRATGRFFAEILSGMICYIGYIMVGFDAEKRALHDHICSTRVVYK
jgi:uncharacterized RDD family membrane protein YckC